MKFDERGTLKEIYPDEKVVEAYGYRLNLYIRFYPDGKLHKATLAGNQMVNEKGIAIGRSLRGRKPAE